MYERDSPPSVVGDLGEKLGLTADEGVQMNGGVRSGCRSTIRRRPWSATSARTSGSPPTTGCR
jgi:hypothetical protein